jgi:hypothetical protein
MVLREMRPGVPTIIPMPASDDVISDISIELRLFGLSAARM